jgi:alpha-tubulin suppressor-like RCC1 family protein
VTERKVIQLIAAEDILYALCDDGTVWRWQAALTYNGEWKEMPPVPQPQLRERADAVE